MKLFLFILITSLFICCSKHETSAIIKSVTKTIDGDLLEKKEFDENGILNFEKHDQIDYGKDGSVIFMFAFEKDTINDLIFEYSANSNTGLELTIDSIGVDSLSIRKRIAIYDEIGDRGEFRSKLTLLNSRQEFIAYFKTIYPENNNFKYDMVFSDTIRTEIVKYLKKDTIIIETKKTQGEFIIEQSKEFYNLENQKIKEITTGKFNRKQTNYFENNNIILQKEKGQYYKFYYQDNLLVKKEIYHGDSLAFVNEYFYKNDLITKEIKYRITESKYFTKIPKIQTIFYHYKFY